MKKILFVDDHEKIRELVSITLGGDYETYEAGTGEQAVEIARRVVPDMIIMDVMMPGKLDGCQAAKIIRESPETKNAYILMLTAKGQQSDISEGFQSGADDYFLKPFSPIALVRKVESVLGVS